jgi:DNA-binding response OmpR family regulator
MRILIVEDYQLLRDSIARGLREEGYAVDTAADGQTGLMRAGSGEYDVVILDLNLPKIDGLTVLKKIRSSGGGPHVLVLTARDTTEDRVKGLDLGADDYVVKPFVFAELVARVRALIRRKYNARSAVIQVADLELDTNARTVRRGGQAVELSAREYALLEYMALRAGQVVSRSDIWEHVYDFNAPMESNVVDVYIGHLRKKIERPDLPKLLQTRRGHGYVLGPAAEEVEQDDEPQTEDESA